MIKNVFKKLKRATKAPDALPDENENQAIAEVTAEETPNPLFSDEYKLLVSKGRVIDYAHTKNSYNLNVDVGIYNDTHEYLTKGLDEALVKLNVFKVLSSATHYFEKMINDLHRKISKEKQKNPDYQHPSERLQKLFLVDDLELPNGKVQGVFCLNLLTRPDALFIVIGLKPKGKLRTRPGDKDNVIIWSK